MRVIDAEKLDKYLTSIIRKAREDATFFGMQGADVMSERMSAFAQDLSTIADDISEMSQEGELYLTPSTTQSSDMSGAGRIHPLHSHE